MKPITRKEYYLAKAAGTYTGPTPPPVLREDYYLATLAGDYSGYCPAPVTRLDMFMSAAAGLTSYVPQPITRLEMYWYNIAKGTGYVPEPATREEQLLYAIIHKEPQYIDKTAEGSTILLTDSAEASFTALTIYGHSTQSGTPSPDNPVPIVSAGDEGEINVSVSDGGTQSQTLTLSTPGGIPGIPVSYGGNYTDESGQQWICDEIDLKRGKYIQRVKKINVKSVNHYDLSENFGSIKVEGILNTQSRVPVMSNRFVFKTSIKDDGTCFAYVDAIRLYYNLGSLENFNKWLTENDVVVWYPLDTFIETDLPAEEIATYNTLHTYSPATTVSNDAAAWMEVRYKAIP